MFWLFKTTIPVLISLIATFFVNKNYKKINSNEDFIWKFSFIWIFLFLFQYFLGHYSPISYYDNATIGLARIIHDTQFHLGGKFAHNIHGGADYFSVQGFLAAYVSLERLLFQTFPIWIAVLLHKFLLVSFNLFGAYLLFNKGFKFNSLDSIFVASLISIINPFATYHSLQHGIGFAVIPFAIYVFLYTSSSKRYFIYTTLLSFLISISTSPLHSFQALLGGLVLTGFLRKPENIKFSLISILILLSFVLINWSEVLYGLMTYGQLTSRVLSSDNLMNPFGLLPYLINKSEYCFINCSYQYSPIAILILIVLFSLVIKFRKEYVKRLKEK